MQLILPSNSIEIKESHNPSLDMKREKLLEIGTINNNENFTYYIYFDRLSSYSKNPNDCIIFIHINQIVEEKGKTIIYHSMAITDYNRRYGTLDTSINLFLSLKKKNKLQKTIVENF